MRLKVILEESDEGGFKVYVPSLPGFISEGDTEEAVMEKNGFVAKRANISGRLT